MEADTWQAYVQALCKALGGDDQATSVTTHHEGTRQTRIHAELDGVELSIEIEAEDHVQIRARIGVNRGICVLLAPEPVAPHVPAAAGLPPRFRMNTVSVPE